METKPYSLQAPEQIAKEYGGNKQAIAQAAQQGIVDPTAAILAGMFIDRMRNAAAMEQAPMQTVAQDVMAPPQPQMPQMPQAPQMPPQMGVPSQPSMGLPDIPIPENMYEPSYAGGGIIAFDAGGAVDPALDPMAEMIKKMQGFYNIPLSDAELAYQERLKSAPERAKSAKERSLNEFMVDMGFRMAGSKAPTFLQAAGESGAAASPTLFGGAKEAKEIEEAGLKGMADIGRAERTQKISGITSGIQEYGREQDRLSRERQADLDRQNRLNIADIPSKELQVAAELRKNNPGMSYLESIDQAAKALSPKDTYNATRTAVSAAAKDANAEFNMRATFDPKLQADIKAAAQGDQAAAQRVKNVRDGIDKEIFKRYQVEGVDLSGGKMGNTRPNDPLGIR